MGFVCAAILVVAFHSALLRAAGQVLVEDDGPHKADAALVLGGDESCTRTERAAELAEAGYVPIVYVSGPPMYGRPESDLTISCAVEHGSPAAVFRAVPDDCDSTRSEAVFFGRFFRRHSVHSLLLVTSNYHTRRAAELMRRINPWLRVWVTAAADPSFSPNNWWKSRDGQKTFFFEWVKTINTWLGH